MVVIDCSLSSCEWRAGRTVAQNEGHCQGGMTSSLLERHSSHNSTYLINRRRRAADTIRILYIINLSLLFFLLNILCSHHQNKAILLYYHDLLFSTALMTFLLTNKERLYASNQQDSLCSERAAHIPWEGQKLGGDGSIAGLPYLTISMWMSCSTCGYPIITITWTWGNYMKCHSFVMSNCMRSRKQAKQHLRIFYIS